MCGPLCKANGFWYRIAKYNQAAQHILTNCSLHQQQHPQILFFAYSRPTTANNPKNEGNYCNSKRRLINKPQPAPLYYILMVNCNKELQEKPNLIKTPQVNECVHKTLGFKPHVTLGFTSTCNVQGECYHEPKHTYVPRDKKGRLLTSYSFSFRVRRILPYM